MNSSTFFFFKERRWNFGFLTLNRKILPIVKSDDGFVLYNMGRISPTYSVAFWNLPPFSMSLIVRSLVKILLFCKSLLCGLWVWTNVCGSPPFWAPPVFPVSHWRGFREPQEPTTQLVSPLCPWPAHCSLFLPDPVIFFTFSVYLKDGEIKAIKNKQMPYFLCLPKAGRGRGIGTYPSAPLSAPTSAAGSCLSGLESALFFSWCPLLWATAN